MTSSQRRYPYYNSLTKTFDFSSTVHTLRQNAQPNDVVIFHACAHNPTGLDPTQSQWMELASLCKEKQLFVLFDCAYQGFASGDLDKDA